MTSGHVPIGSCSQTNSSMTDLSISSIRHHPSYLACSPIVAQRHMSRTAKVLSAPSSNYRTLDSLHDIPYVVITNIRTSRQTHTDLEDCFRHTIHVCRSILIARLFVHRFPHWPEIKVIHRLGKSMTCPPISSNSSPAHAGNESLSV